VVTIASEDGHHALSHIAAWRQLSDPSGHASRAVLGQLGDSFKSAWRYVYSVSTFDNVGSPRSGWGYRAETEVTGLAPDPYLLRHIKHQIVTKIALPLTDTSAFSLTLETGALFPWGSGGGGGMSNSGGGGQRRGGSLFEQTNSGTTTNTNGGNITTPISDRFFLGGLGPGALRGFRRCGVGPSDARRVRVQRGGGDIDNNKSEETPSVGELDRGRDALGGDLFFSLLAAVNFELPFEAAREVGIRGHVFLNGGSLVGLGRGGNGVGGVGEGGRISGVKGSVNEMVSKIRWCVGAGLVWPTRIGMLEVNVCKVLSHQVNDRPMSGPGFQFGFTPSHW
jgi:outer membrane protein insertion porin family